VKSYINTKIPFIIVVLLVFSLMSIDAWGLTSAELKASIRAATTGCPAFTITNPATGGPTLNATNYGVSTNNTGAQNYTDFANAIAACNSSNAYKLIVPTGTYKIGKYGSTYGSCLLNFNSLSDFIFDGQGSVFLMESKEDFIHVMNCSRVVLQNYTMGWDWTNECPESLVQVTNVTSTYMDLQYPYESNPVPNASIYELDEACGTNYDFSHEGAGEVGDSTSNSLAIPATAEGTGRLRYTTPHSSGWFASAGFKVGQYYIVRHYAYEFKGNDVENNNNLTFSNVTVYSTLGMGYSINYNRNYQIINSRLVREPGTIYRLSSSSDGINVTGSHGYFRVLNDEIGQAGDDSINIHDGCSEGIKVVSSTSLIASNCLSYRNPFDTISPVELRKGDYTPFNWSSVPTSVSSYRSDNTVTLTFGIGLPAGLTNDSIIWGHKYDSGNYVISNCYIHENKGKGAFVHCSNGTIENNSFINNWNPGLFIASINSKYGSGSIYGEGYDPSNILVLNNQFIGNNILRNNEITDTYFPNDIVIVGQTGPEAIADYPICQDIIFENNLVENSTHASMEIASATNVLVENNTFENPNLWNDEPANIVAGCIMIQQCSSVIFDTNALIIGSGVTSYMTNIYVDSITATNNIFVSQFASVAVGAGPPVIGQDIEPAYLTAYIGNTNTFSIAMSGSTPFAYQWYQNGLPIVYATNQDYPFSVLYGTNTYYCSVTNSYSAGMPTTSSTATVVGISATTLSPPDFASCLKITINGYNRGETLNDFPLLVQLGTNVTGFSYQQFASAAGGDLRFTDAGGTREVPYEINQWNTNGISSVWVQMPTLYGTNDMSGTNNIIYAYWGNPDDATAPDFTTNGAVWVSAAPSYEVVYHLEQSGFPYLDSTLQYPANNGIAPVSTNCLIGRGLSFKKTPYLDAGLVNLGNAFTLSAWVNVPSSASSIQTVWGNGNGVAESAEFLFYVDNYNTSDGSLILTTGDGGATEQQLKSAPGAVGLGQWHLVTAVVDRTGGNAQLYVDGNQVASGPAMTDFPTGTDMDLGQDNGNSFQFTGLMDEARIRSGLSSTNWIWASWMTVATNSSFESYAAVSSSSVSLNIQHSGNSVILTWPEGTLQSAGAVGGPYSDIPAAASPYTNAVSGTQEFYRVRVQ